MFSIIYPTLSWDKTQRSLGQPLRLVSWKSRVYDRKHLPTQPLTKITPYTLKRIAFTTSRASEIKARAKKALPINLHSEKYIMILQTPGLNYKKKKKKTLHPTDLPRVFPPWYCHADMTDVISLFSISIRHTHVILLCPYVPLSINLPYPSNWLLPVPNTI